MIRNLTSIWFLTSCWYSSSRTCVRKVESIIEQTNMWETIGCIYKLNIKNNVNTIDSCNSYDLTFPDVFSKYCKHPGGPEIWIHYISKSLYTDYIFDLIDDFKSKIKKTIYLLVHLRIDIELPKKYDIW